MAYFSHNSRGRLVIDMKPLTLFRLHSGNHFAYKRKYTLSDFIEKNKKYYEFRSEISERIKINLKTHLQESLLF